MNALLLVVLSLGQPPTALETARGLYIRETPRMDTLAGTPKHQFYGYGKREVVKYPFDEHPTEAMHVYIRYNERTHNYVIPVSPVCQPQPRLYDHKYRYVRPKIVAKVKPRIVSPNEAKQAER